MEETKMTNCCGNSIRKEALDEAVSEQAALREDVKKLKKYFRVLLVAIVLIIITAVATSCSLFIAINRIAELNHTVGQLQLDIAGLSDEKLYIAAPEHGLAVNAGIENVQ